MARIFLCHASEDKAQVREVYHHLRAIAGFEPWLDEIDISPGQDWDYEIERALEDSDFVIVFLSTQVDQVPDGPAPTPQAGRALQPGPRRARVLGSYHEEDRDSDQQHAEYVVEYLAGNELHHKRAYNRAREGGRREAVDSLRSHLARETAPSVQSQLRAAIDRLTIGDEERIAVTAAARPRAAKVLVKVGQLRNDVEGAAAIGVHHHRGDALQ